MKKNSKIDKFFSFLYFTGLVVLAYIIGAMVIHYNLPSSRSLINGFIAAEAYLKEFEESDEDKKLADDVRNDLTAHSEEVIQNPQVTWNKDLAYNGYTLISTGYLSFPYLVDMEGKVVFRWRVPVKKVWSGVTGCSNVFKVGVYFVNRARVFPNGDMLAQFSDWGAPYGCGMIKVDKDANILWVYEDLVHHDFAVDEKGNTFTATRKTLTDPVPGLEELPTPINVDYIVKLDPNGKEMSSFSLLEAFKDSPYEILLLHRDHGWGDDIYDYFHTNSLDVLKPEIAAKFPQFKAGDLLISARALGVLAVVDPETKKVVWAYRGFLKYQHSATFLPNGHILVLDNQGHIDTNGKYSRVVELNPVTLGVEWMYVGNKENPFNTEKVGDAQRLPNGNTLIAESAHARIFEVTKDGKVVWTYKLAKKLSDTEYSEAIFTALRFTDDDLPFLKTVKKETDEPKSQQPAAAGEKAP